MDKEFVKYEQALALKELGFNEKCIAADYYADGKICIQYTDEGITNAELDEITAQCNEDAVENGENPIDYDPAVPLYSQAFRWFREKHNLCGEVYTVNMGAIDYTFQIRDLYSEDIKHDNFEAYTGGYTGTFLTYEEAESACLDKLIEIVKNNAHI